MDKIYGGGAPSASAHGVSKENILLIQNFDIYRECFCICLFSFSSCLLLVAYIRRHPATPTLCPFASSRVIAICDAPQ